MDQVKKLYQTITSFSIKYGPAWIITVQTLGWISFVAIYCTLAFSGVNVGELARSYKLNKDLISLADAGGLFALTFGVNRLLAPIRVIIAVFLVPKVAEPINRVVRPWIAMIWKETPKDETKKS
ncbi:hypothetical protein HDU67_001875 [Dinochytrium kinnereticum]|nr:hypothetical protein HDU67_001875 [Dinochytrium kinnereticum]